MPHLSYTQSVTHSPQYCLLVQKHSFSPHSSFSVSHCLKKTSLDYMCVRLHKKWHYFFSLTCVCSKKYLIRGKQEVEFQVSLPVIPVCFNNHEREKVTLWTAHLNFWVLEGFCEHDNVCVCGGGEINMYLWTYVCMNMPWRCVCVCLCLCVHTQVSMWRSENIWESWSFQVKWVAKTEPRLSRLTTSSFACWSTFLVLQSLYIMC